MSFVEKNENELIYMSSTLISSRHAFTTRYGGVSEGIFSSLNLGSHRGDDQTNVEENYRRVCALMGVGVNDCAVTKQVHSSVVRIVTEADRHPVGTTIPYVADGIVTNIKRLPLMCFSADCIPVLLEDEAAGVIAAVHCGWKGSVADIISEAVAAMQSLGAESRRIHAALGPAIGACCFETDSDVPEAVDKWLGEGSVTYTLRADGKYLVDLRKANALRLESLGVLESNIDISDECTMCSNRKYWSHRYTRGARGVQCGVIVLE